MKKWETKHTLAAYICVWIIGSPALYALFVGYREPLFAWLMLPLLGFVVVQLWRVSRPRPESLNAPRNLLTHRDETVVAMMKVENPIFWLVFQRDKDPYSLKRVTEELMRMHRERPEVAEDGEQRIAMLIRDSDGRPAWGVTPFGEVLYVRAGEETYPKAVRAKEHGFRIVDAQ